MCVSLIFRNVCSETAARTERRPGDASTALECIIVQCEIKALLIRCDVLPKCSLTREKNEKALNSSLLEADFDRFCFLITL